MRVTLSALSLALAVTQGQAQGLSTCYLPSNAFGASKASWWLSAEIIAAASAAGTYGLRSLATALQSPSEVETHPANKLDYHWNGAALLTVCSKKTFQLLAMPSEPGPSLTVSKPQLQEQGGYCTDVIPMVPEGKASLYFNSDGGQIDFNRSTLTVNGQPVPLAQLKPIPTETPVPGSHLTLASGMIEGWDPASSTPVRLDGSHPAGRQVPVGKQPGGGGRRTPPPSYEEAAGGGGATGGAAGGGSGTGRGDAGAGGSGDDPRKPARTDNERDLSQDDEEILQEVISKISEKVIKRFVNYIEPLGAEGFVSLGTAGVISFVNTQIETLTHEEITKSEVLQRLQVEDFIKVSVHASFYAHFKIATGAMGE